MRDSILGPNREGDLPFEDEEDLPIRPERSIPRRGRPRKTEDVELNTDVETNVEVTRLPGFGGPTSIMEPVKSDPSPEKLAAVQEMIQRQADFEAREAEKYRVTPDSPYYDLSKSDPNPEFEKETKKMAKKDDIASMVGKELLNNYKAAARDLAAAQLDPTVSPLASVANTISAKTVGDLATQFPTINMRIKRRNPTTMRWEIIPGPRGIDPKTITEPGALEDLILNWSGGGEYDIELAAPGTKGFVPISFTIDAPPIPTPAFRGQAANTSFPVNSPQDVMAKYAAQTQGHAMAQQQQEQSGLLKLVEQMLAMQLAQTMGQRQEVAPSREVEELKRQTLELQAQLRASEERARADRERSEMMQRLDEISRRVDAASQQKADPLVTLLTAFAPIAPALLSKGDAAAQTMANMMQAVIGQQQQSSTTTLELFKAMNNKPEVEERFANLIGTMGNMSANTMAMVTQVIQAGLLEKGGDSPITQIISQVIGEAADVAKTVFASGALTGGGGGQEAPRIEAPTALPSLPPPMRPMPAALTGHVQDGPIGGVIDADEDENEGEENENENNENENENEVASTTSEALAPSDNNTYDLMRDTAFREILMRIRNNGDVRDVAVRLYKHGQVVDPTQGHPVAKAWFTDPQNAGRGIMGQLGIEPARIEEIVAAIEALTQYLASGKELNDYMPTRRNRESRRIPATSATSTPLGEHFDETTIQRVSTVVPVPPTEGISQPATVEPVVAEAAVAPIVES